MSDTQSNPTPKAEAPAVPPTPILPQGVAQGRAELGERSEPQQQREAAGVGPNQSSTQGSTGRASGVDATAAQQETPKADAAKPTQPTTDTASSPRAEGAKTEAPDPAARQQDTPNARGTERDPIRDLLVTLGSTVQPVADIDRMTARNLQIVLGQGIDPAVHADPGFRHQVAYAVQDVEKLLRERLPMSGELRTEMTEKAGSASGLENERMLALMRATGNIDDHSLVRDIRLAATNLGRQADQNTPANLSGIENFENRVRLGQRPDEPHGAAPATPSAGAKDDAAERAAGQRSPPPQFPSQDQQPSNVTINRSVLDVLLSGLRGAADGIRNEVSPPWEPPHTPMRDRLAAFEARLENERNERLVGNAERNGQAALDALRGLQANESSGVLERIREAGRNNPGGLEGVLSEMRPGGRFADLRTEFNDALVRDRGFAAAYDRAAGALAQYGQDRTTVDLILTKAPDTKLADTFESLDAKIGEAASLIPSKKDGNSMLDDLTKQIGELFQRAVDSVRSVFSRAAGTQASHSGPSPSP